MKKALLLALPLFLLATLSCNEFKKPMNGKMTMFIQKSTIDKVIHSLTDKYGDAARFRIEKGISQAAFFWRKEDGKESDFEQFCSAYFIPTESGQDSLFQRLMTDYETLFGNLNKINLELKKPLHLDQGPILPIDQLIGAYDPYAHLQDDFYQNKIAFVVLLNFPFYSLKEKNELGPNWTRKQWAYARIGDFYLSRVPAGLQQKYSKATTDADTYISEYNIFMGNLIDKTGKTFFPADMKLISHWGIRDELKSHYADKTGGLEKQKLIYQVMKRIIDQSIPQAVINNKDLKWDPYENKVRKGKGVMEVMEGEPNTRYKYLLENFRAASAMDAYNPFYPTFIDRAFEQGMEIPQSEVEKLFTEFCSSPQVKEVAALITKRMGRPLQPFDIWYDGFKGRSAIPEEELNKIVGEKYPTPQAFAADFPNILVKLGFSDEKAQFLASKIEIDPARGSGHAWGTQMKADKSHLRTRIPATGMNYKGFNIAIHEFGHNVEQTITMQDVDYYAMTGVPTTAFTEALAFIFQKRDLELLGFTKEDPNKFNLMTLDNFWAAYEIMGVSLVDMKVWKWMYANPNTSPEKLKEYVITAAKEVWNQYYAPVFGMKDEPILAVYSHMIDNPLYLSSYPVGHLIDFQIEKQIQGKSFASEVERMFKAGRLTPEVWMKQAVGEPVSIKPMLEATTVALKAVDK
ncbi:MAG: hypothetical protein NTU44_00640 [Bacteroidetes bacterium]|nr:hypothetical protein [Bacteroidota bacterium]